MASSGRRKIHLDVDGIPLCGAAAVLQSTSGDPDATGSVCRKCQRVMERLLRPVLAPQHSPPEDRPMTTPSHRPVAAGVIAADPDNVAPVSGPRCRGCGANAGRAPAGQEWTVTDGAAYCPGCRGVPVDVPPGTPLHELARLAADAPEVRREVVRDTVPPLIIAGGGVVFVLMPGRRDPALELPEAEAARRLLAWDEMLAALEEADVALGQNPAAYDRHPARAAVAAALRTACP